MTFINEKGLYSASECRSCNIAIANQFFMDINTITVKLTGTPGPPLDPLCPAAP